MSMRRTGLSYGDRPKPLLKVIRGKSRETRDKDENSSSREGSDALTKTWMSMPPVDDINAVSDESSSTAPSRAASEAVSNHSDDYGGPVRGEIKPTTFGAPKGSQKGQHKGLASEEMAEGEKGAKRRKLSRGSTPKSSQPQSSAGSNGAPSSSGDHLLDSHGFTKKNNVKATFGKKGTLSQETDTSASRKKRLGMQSKTQSKDQHPKSTSGFILLSPGQDDSPKKKKDGFMPLQGPTESSPCGPKKTGFKAEYESDSSIPTPEPKPKKNKMGGKRNGPRSGGEDEAEPQAPVFKMFDDDDFDITTLDTTRPEPPLSEPDSDDLGGPVRTELPAATPTASVCPWCGDEVDEKLLLDFSKGQRMNVRQQTRFCQNHKKQAAVDKWSALSYPTIDWEALPDRISAHADFLLGVIDGTQPSHYRSVLAKKIASGKDRTLKKEGNLSPGYYGPRGFNLMCDSLVGRFGETLKQRAVQDRVISGRGSAAFIQSVLVAELGVQLIREDMDVSATRARKILEESKDIGDMVNGDEAW